MKKVTFNIPDGENIGDAIMFAFQKDWIRTESDTKPYQHIIHSVDMIGKEQKEIQERIDAYYKKQNELQTTL